MKILQGAVQASGYWYTRLVDPEDLDLLRLEDTGELVEGMDFAVRWSGVWREGRCYETASGRSFVTYGDAERLPLYHGLEARLPLYTLSTERLLELAHSYARELGYTPTQQGTIVSEQVSFSPCELAGVEIRVEGERLPVVITIRLASTGDISLVASTETFLMPGSEEDAPLGNTGN